MVKEEELGDVESEVKEKISATVVASVSTSSSVISSKRCRLSGGKATQTFWVQIQQAKDREKLK